MDLLGHVCSKKVTASSVEKEQKKGRGRTHRRTHVIIFSSPEGEYEASLFESTGGLKDSEETGENVTAAEIRIESMSTSGAPEYALLGVSV